METDARRTAHDRERPDMTLKNFSIHGTASPEGRYDLNKKLADGRMQSAMDIVTRSIPESMRRHADISSSADVATWKEVEALLRADGLDNEADAVRKVIDRYPRDINQQSARMRSVPVLQDNPSQRLSAASAPRKLPHNIIALPPPDRRGDSPALHDRPRQHVEISLLAPLQ